MKKKMYRSVLALLLGLIVLLTTAVCSLFYDVLRAREMQSIQDRANLIAELLNNGIAKDAIGAMDGQDGIFSDYITDDPNVARLLIIAPDGSVVLDNRTHADEQPSHMNRTEVQEAFQNGIGKTIRTSSTTGAETYYYAVRLQDGNVLRVSMPLYQMAGVFRAVIPAVLLIAAMAALLAYLLTRRLTKNVLEPIYAIDLEGDAPVEYEELRPYVRKIRAQKRQIEAQMQDLNARAQLIMTITESMREGILYVAPDGKVRTANASALRIFDTAQAEGKSVRALSQDLAFWEELDRAQAGEARHCEMARAGRVYEVYLTPMREDGAQAGTILLFLDCTEKKHAEQQRRDFSANVSHEMKTPLTTISAIAEMMEHGMVQPADVQGFAAKISTQARGLINTIEDLIKLSQFDGGTLTPEASAVDLQALAGEVLRDFADRAAARAITLRVEGDAPTIAASPRLLHELIFNLVDNAIKYNRDGGEVGLYLGVQDGACVISVRDTGIGIAPEHQARIFERFYRVDRSRSRKTGGTGLGLSLVKHISEYYGGAATVKSAEGTGTQITCTLQVPILQK